VDPFPKLLVRMPFRKAKLGRGVAFEVKLDEHRRLIADNTPIVTGFDDDDLRRGVVAHAAVLEGHVNFAACQKADMGVHTELSADMRLDVARPMEADRIDRSLHASVAGADNVELDSAELAMLCFRNWCEEWIGSGHGNLQFQVSAFRSPATTARFQAAVPGSKFPACRFDALLNLRQARSAYGSFATPG